jgi:hypothetical protein
MWVHLDIGANGSLLNTVELDPDRNDSQWQEIMEAKGSDEEEMPC